MPENPLKQYFRRPSIYIRLPSAGKYYAPGVIELPPNGELAVYPMTAVDEVTSKTPDALYNGNAIVEIIKSCVPGIKDPWKLNSTDLDTLLIAIRVASNGEAITVESTCPECGSTHDYSLNLQSLLAGQTPVDYDGVLSIRDLEVKFKPITYHESNAVNLAQFEIQKTISVLNDFEDTPEKAAKIQEAIKKLNALMVDILVQTVEWIRTPEVTVSDQAFIKDFLLNCDRATHNEIKNHSIKLKTQNQLKPFKIQCVNCQHIYDQEVVLNITDFFE